MKKIESNSICQSFGISEINNDELYTINGGTEVSSVSIGDCKNIGEKKIPTLPIIPRLMGVIAIPPIIISKPTTTVS